MSRSAVVLLAQTGEMEERSLPNRSGRPSITWRRLVKASAALLRGRTAAAVTCLLPLFPVPSRTALASDNRVVLAAVGDIMLSRGVAEKIREHGFDYPLSGVGDVVASADIGFCNLECVLTDQPRPPSRGFVFRADPRNAPSLKLAGFDLVSVANNHALDCGIDGHRETIEVLRSANLVPVSRVPVTYEVNGLTVGALAYDLVDTHILDETAEAVRELDDLVDIVIVSLHWGIEYRLSPADWQRRLAQDLVDCGADLILGHHPHRVQGISCYRRAVIVYSMGNCVFDQRDLLGNESVILLVELTQYGVREITILPTRITGFRPAVAEGAAGEKIISALADHSQQLGTNLLKIHEGNVSAARFYPFRDVTRVVQTRNSHRHRRTP